MLLRLLWLPIYGVVLWMSKSSNLFVFEWKRKSQNEASEPANHLFVSWKQKHSNIFISTYNDIQFLYSWKKWIFVRKYMLCRRNSNTKTVAFPRNFPQYWYHFATKSIDKAGKSAESSPFPRTNLWGNSTAQQLLNVHGDAGHFNVAGSTI